MELRNQRNDKKEFFGEGRLKNLIMENHDKCSHDISQLILHQVRLFHEGMSQNDDITLGCYKSNLIFFNKKLYLYAKKNFNS